MNTSFRRSLSLIPMVALLLTISCGDQVVVRETQASCGNGSIEEGEACDDGTLINTDGCSSGCALATCGDGITRSDLSAEDPQFEACADGNADDLSLHAGMPILEGSKWVCNLWVWDPKRGR